MPTSPNVDGGSGRESRGNASRRRRTGAAVDPGWESTLIATWRGNDPTTTITLQWLSSDDAPRTVELTADGDDSTTDTTDVTAFGDSSWYRHRAVGDQLLADTRYDVSIDGSDTGLSVRTAPREVTESLTFAEGGDIGTSSNVLRLHRQAADWDPLFGFVGGDLAYADGTDADLWVTFLEYWSEEMRHGDRLIPIVAAIGNHEVQGGMHASPDEAPFFYALFDNPHREHAYWTFDIGSFLSIVILDSNHTTEVTGAQTEWLDETLAERTGQQHLMVAYHVPAYPSAHPIDARDRDEIRSHWVPLFEQYDVDIAFEHDDHTYKRTYPLRDGERASEDGLLYVGDGAWGMQPLTVKDRDYLDVAKSSRNVIRTELRTDGSQQYRAVDETGAILDRFGTFSVSATGDSMPVGGNAEISVSAQNVDQVTIRNLWTDWDLVEFEADGGSFSDRVSGAGVCNFRWDTEQGSVAPSVTVDLPERYVGGEYLIDVVGANTDQSGTDTATVQIVEG